MQDWTETSNKWKPGSYLHILLIKKILEKANMSNAVGELNAISYRENIHPAAYKTPGIASFALVGHLKTCGFGAECKKKAFSYKLNNVPRSLLWLLRYIRQILLKLYFSALNYCSK